MIVLLPSQELYSDVFGSIEGGKIDWNIKPLIDYVLLCDGVRLQTAQNAIQYDEAYVSTMCKGIWSRVTSQVFCPKCVS